MTSEQFPSMPIPAHMRVERDSFGPIPVPTRQLWGAQTQRALLHFAISHERMPTELVAALAQVKRACAYVNHSLGLLSPSKTTAIVAACDEIIAGAHTQEFPLPVWQSGSGTQTNMNINEVVANRASEMLGGTRGAGRIIHPNDDVNLSQSSNDVFPTAMHVAAVVALQQRLLPALELLRQTGSMIESPAGYLHLTAQENLEIVADLKGVPHKDIGRVLDIVHLTQDRNRRVGQYSLGMKQRLGIAMALLGSPKLLILDEPTNGLDPAGIQEMRALIRNMPAATGATVLISSHLLGEMEQMVEQVGIIDHGHILFEGPLTELQRHSREIGRAHV